MQNPGGNAQADASGSTLLPSLEALLRQVDEATVLAQQFTRNIGDAWGRITAGDNTSSATRSPEHPAGGNARTADPSKGSGLLGLLTGGAPVEVETEVQVSADPSAFALVALAGVFLLAFGALRRRA